ncbi:UDP-glucose:hexose-1-phosphate uridylyltransferase [Sugiyamaella lignohabitans]|uniref:Galactose-1-phosphate uridylyltransferase n=1 Tax=Sugiyamaella lignohabitans TaxID=796027 RepID=A0A167EC78_9ASCO|nr:UDP-glucose:hexose-1-phosphate uridylyltransferase [Sugiyamaella lignohabitans]ANB13895.1 UDP-glucose:hexose-1-phosphate uridylyltransferase [Sugiyamaella lignohabitans]
MQWSEAHRRYNPLRKSWVLCSPHRTQRPWQGQQEKPQVEKRPEYDEKCYLCPGNTRAQGQANPKYEETFVFVNDFSAVKPRDTLPQADGSSAEESEEDELFRAEQATGKCVVICFNPRHDITLAQMTYPQVSGVINAWKKVYTDAVNNPEVRYCQIFENKGAAMGCSNPHPHGQAWTTNIIPEEPDIEHACLAEYAHNHNGKGLLEDYVAKELAILAKAESSGNHAQNRFVDVNDSFIAVIPFWATWPFEVLVVSRRKIGNITQLTEKEQTDFAHILRNVALRYDNLFQTSFPYSMGIHQSFAEPNIDPKSEPEHLHVHFYPPLLRSATVRKFLVGFEMLGMPQRDVTPESAAAQLRAVDGNATVFV